MITANSETRTGLVARKSELTAQIRNLIQAQESIALEAAEGDADAPKRLADNYSEVAKATNELRAIDAAMRALERREHQASIQTSLDLIESDRASARAHVLALRQAYQRVESALRGVGDAWRTLQDAQDSARKSERACRGPTHNDVVTAGSASVFYTAQSIDVFPLVQGCLWREVGPLDPNQEMAAATIEVLDRQIDKALLNIESGLRRREQALRQKLSEVSQAT